MKKVLIVTYYWPPSAGSGVQRWVKFAKYLPEFGWEPIIFTPENPDFPIKDDSLIKDLPSTLEVLHFPIWEPYQVQRILFGKNKHSKPTESWEKKDKSILDFMAVWLRGNIFIPDPKRFWVRPSVKFLTEVVKEKKIDAVITTGPPHSLHLIGLRLKKKIGIKWIADFRDPWSKWELLDTLNMTPIARKLQRKAEYQVLKNADSTITISPTFKNDFESILNRNVNVITNGFDPDDFLHTEESKFGDKFRISHVGTIDDLRDPRPFLEAIRLLVQEDKDLMDNIEIIFVGVVSNRLVSEVNNDGILSKIVIFREYIPHKEVFKLYKQSFVLLLVLANSKNAEGNIPGKLFEYMASGNLILGLGKPDGDSAKIVNDAGVGAVCLPEDGVKIKEMVYLYYNKWKKNEDNVSRNIEAYTRKSLTKKLADVLQDIV